MANQPQRIVVAFDSRFGPSVISEDAIDLHKAHGKTIWYYVSQDAYNYRGVVQEDLLAQIAAKDKEIQILKASMMPG